MRKTNGLSIAGFVTSLVSVVLFWIPYFGTFICLVAFGLSISGFLVALYKNNRKGLAISGLVVSIVFLIFSALVLSFVESVPVDDTEESNAAVQEEPQKTPQEIADEFKADCVEPNYENLLRYPEHSINKKVVVKVCVRQIMDNYENGDDVWRAYTDEDGYGLYYSDEYFLVDAREIDKLKILTDDIIFVYGEFKGTEKITRSIGLATDELPRIDVKYIELTEENPI